MSRVQWWLQDSEGVRVTIDAGGVLLGRSPGCDLVLRDTKASRSQALVYLADGRPRLILLGKGRTLHNGERIVGDAQLAAGDMLVFPGASLSVGRGPDREDSRGGWVLARSSGGFFGVPSGPFVIGGHECDDLRLPAWPDHALTLHLTQHRLHLAALAELEVDGNRVSHGALVPLSPGSCISFAGETLRVITGIEVSHGSTVGSADDDHEGELPKHVRLEFLPRGGRLYLSVRSGQRTVYLPGKRSELMALLLKPPAPYELGETLDDELVIMRLWPRQARTRIDLNTLIYRLRKDLVAAGIDASGFVVRAPGGGGTKVGLTNGARVEVA